MATKSETQGRRTQNERVQESSRRLLDAAVSLIAEQGFEKTTVAQIGRRAGYSHSMVHARYGSKDALLESVFRSEWQERLLPEDGDLTGLDRVLDQVDRLIKLVEEERDLVRAIVVLSFELTVHGAALKPWPRDWFDRYFQLTVENLRTGVKDGSIRSGLDHRAEARRFAAYGMGLGFMWSLDWDGYGIEEALADWRRRIKADFSYQD